MPASSVGSAPPTQFSSVQNMITSAQSNSQQKQVAAATQSSLDAFTKGSGSASPTTIQQAVSSVADLALLQGLKTSNAADVKALSGAVKEALGANANVSQADVDKALQSALAGR